MTITLFDGLLLVIMLISAVLAMIRGFSREVLSIASWAIAGIAAFYFYQLLSPTIAGFIPSLASKPIVIDGIAAALIFLVVLIIVSYLTMLLADMIIDSRIGVLDRTLGFIFGAARGGLLVIIALMGFLWLANENEPQWIAQAKSKPMLVAIGTNLRDSLPENLEETFKSYFEQKTAEDAEEGQQPVE